MNAAPLARAYERLNTVISSASLSNRLGIRLDQDSEVFLAIESSAV